MQHEFLMFHLSCSRLSPGERKKIGGSMTRRSLLKISPWRRSYAFSSVKMSLSLFSGTKIKPMTKVPQAITMGYQSPK